jgi:GNAT superfamily N-acetyltransferase
MVILSGAVNGHIQVVAATPDRVSDVLKVFEGSGERDCWCQYWRQSSSDYGSAAHGPGMNILLQQIRTGPPPGMIAYVEDQPIGWLGFWPRDSFQRLVRSRTIPRIDDQPVWSIVCFKVRAGYRRRGVAKALLRGAIKFARERQVPALEAYPIDSDGQRIDVAAAYVGFTRMFEAAGFRRVCETEARSAGRTRFLMRLEGF